MEDIYAEVDLGHAVRMGDLNRVKTFVESETVNLNRSRYTLYAAEKGHLDILKYLISNDACMLPHLTLFNAIRGDHLEVVKYLIEDYGCDPFVRDLFSMLNCKKVGAYYIRTFKETLQYYPLGSLRFAYWNDDIESMKIVLNNKTIRQTLRNQIQSHITSCIIHGKNEMVQCMMTYSEIMPYFWTHAPLYCACIKDNLQIFKYLFEGYYKFWKFKECIRIGEILCPRIKIYISKYENMYNSVIRTCLHHIPNDTVNYIISYLM